MKSFLVVAALATALHAVAYAEPSASGSHSQRLLVKYRAGVDVCAGCDGRRSGRAGLDALHEALGVRVVAPLFGARGVGSHARTRAFVDGLEAARRRFPTRAARARGVETPDLSRWFVLTFPADADLGRAAAVLAADSAVEAVEPDRTRDAELLTNDPFLATTGSWGRSYPDLWGLHLTAAPAAWDVANGAGVVVAVIDTGVDRAHPDLAANLWINPGETPGNGVDDDGNGFVDDLNGWDFVADDADPKDQHGHGTHVAGTAAAVGANGVGVVGMAYGARIMALRGLDASGSGFDSHLAEAIVYAAVNGADVVNASWGGPGSTTVLRDAVQTARSLGVVIAAAAGNNGGNADYHFPSAYPEVIAVGASQHDDTIAGFSNAGATLSVAAPGVDVLSARGSSSGPVGGEPVGNGYLRLSGTSMATPHVAGLAAVLLSAMPGLTVDEVRWHLELNADQPGAPGYEGEAWNPSFGYGRIDAGRVFDPPPVTTRLQPHDVLLHALTETVMPDAVTLALGFTTLDPVEWTLGAPTWLAPAQAAGTGPGSIGLTLDTTGLAPATMSDVVTIAAPAAVDGGAALAATVVVHRDERYGPAFGIPDGETTFSGEPSVASNGIGSVVVWGHSGGPALPELRSARIDSSGAATAGSLLDEGFPWKADPVIAGDGRGYLVVWDGDDVQTVQGKRSGIEAILAMRLDAAGVPLDAEPIVVAARKYKDSSGFVFHHVAFDGEKWIVTWADMNSHSDVSKAYFVRIGRDGSVPKKRGPRFYPNKGTTLHQVLDPFVACRAGRCLIAYHQADGETNELGKYVDKIHAVRVEGDTLLDGASFQILRDAESVRDLVATPDGWIVYADRVNFCPGPVLCGDDALAARLDADGRSLDPNGIRLNVSPPGGTDMLLQRATFDGTHFVGAFMVFPGMQIFAGRLALDGTVPDDEPEGLLLHPEGTLRTGGRRASMASTRDHSLLVWNDTIENGGVQDLGEVRIQRVLPHPPQDGLTTRPIGGIGALSAAEDERVAFVLAAPGLDPERTVFSATGLPPGAELDAASGAFHWKPAPDESGLALPPVRFAAADGTSSVTEDVTLAVSEAVGALGGTLRLGNGDPVSGAVLRVTGTVGGPHFVRTDPTGRFRMFGVAPGVYRVKLDKPTKSAFRAVPASATVTVPAGDVLDVDFVLTPR